MWNILIDFKKINENVCMGDGKRLAVLEEKSNDSFIELKNYYYVAFFRPQNFHLINTRIFPFRGIFETNQFVFT